MKLTQVKGNTWVLEGLEFIPLYRLDGGRCILMDTGLAQEREELEQTLLDHGLAPAGVVLPRPCGPRGKQPLFSGEIPHPRGPHLPGGWDVRQPVEPEVLFSAPLPGHGRAGRRRSGPHAGRAHPRWGRPLLLRRGGVPDPPHAGTLRWAYLHRHPGRGVLCGGRSSLQGAAGCQAALLPIPPDGDGEPGEAAGSGL